MRVFLTFLMISLSISSIVGQVSIGNGRGAGNLWVSNHSKKTFDALKSKKTFFAVPKICNADELISVIKSVWTFNDITFVDIDEVKANYEEKYISSDHIIMGLVDMNWRVEKGIHTVGGFRKVIFYANTYKNVKKRKKGKLDYDILDIAEIYLSGDIVYQNPAKEQYCLQLGIAKNYFQELNRRLLNSESLKMNDGIVKEEKMGELSRHTLYIPWKLYDEASTDEIESHNKFISKTLKPYGYEYELISYDELNEKILNGEDIYYFQHTQFSKFKILSIIHSTNGEIIYLDVESSYKTKSSDIKKVNKIVSDNS